MSLDLLLKDFYENYEKANRLRSEFHELNRRMAEGDPSATLDQYLKVKSIFKDMRSSMNDLDRAVERIKDLLPSTQPIYETPP